MPVGDANEDFVELLMHQVIDNFRNSMRYRDYTHPIRKDVKQKHFCTPLGAIPVWCLHSGPP